MAVNIIRNTTASAPVLSGQLGALIAVFDFALVTTSGWTKVFSGTNLAVYRAPAGNRMYFRVDDNNTSWATIRMYESMTDVNTGVNPTPSIAQWPNGLTIIKSATADTVARAYTIVERNGTVFYTCQSDVTAAVGVANNYPCHTWFGDFVSYKAGDAYNSFISSSSATNNTSAAPEGVINSLYNATSTGTYIARASTQIGTSLWGCRMLNSTFASGASSIGSQGPAYPNVITGGMNIGRIYLGEGLLATGVRGYIPGLWYPHHGRPLTHGDTFSGGGLYAGKSFEASNCSGTGQLFYETSDTW